MVGIQMNEKRHVHPPKWMRLRRRRGGAWGAKLGPDEEKRPSIGAVGNWASDFGVFSFLRWCRWCPRASSSSTSMMMKIIVRGLRSRGCPYRGKRGVAEPTRFEPVRRVLLLQQLRGDRSHRGGGRRRRILVPRRLTHSLPLSLPAARPFVCFSCRFCRLVRSVVGMRLWV